MRCLLHCPGCDWTALLFRDRATPSALSPFPRPRPCGSNGGEQPRSSRTANRSRVSFPAAGAARRHALIGGAIGAVAGFALCATISTLADDSAGGGVSFCPLDTALLIMGGGFALGAAIGWAI